MHADVTGVLAIDDPARIPQAAAEGIPFQRDVRGRDSGTDAMAGVLGNVDCAATSLGFPIRNMHTTSELGEYEHQHRELTTRTER